MSRSRVRRHIRRGRHPLAWFLEYCGRVPKPEGEKYARVEGDCWPLLIDAYLNFEVPRGAIEGRGKDQVIARAVVAELCGGFTKERNQALHLCDRSFCLNPKHLYAGTAQENMRDKHERDRARFRAVHLSEREGQELYGDWRLLDHSKMTVQDLARKYGVSARTVNNYGSGSIRPHLTGALLLGKPTDGRARRADTKPSRTVAA